MPPRAKASPARKKASPAPCRPTQVSRTNASTVEKDLLCPICLSVYVNPTTLACGHNVCQECMVQYLETKSDIDLIFSKVQVNCPLHPTLVPFKVPPVNLPLAQLCEQTCPELTAERKKGLMAPAELKKKIKAINAKAEEVEQSICVMGNGVRSMAGLVGFAAVAVLIALIIGLAVGSGAQEASPEPNFRRAYQTGTGFLTAKRWAYAFPREALWAKLRIDGSPMITSLQIRYPEYLEAHATLLEPAAVSCLRDPSGLWFWMRAIVFPYECALRSIAAHPEATVDAPYTAFFHSWAWRIMHVSRIFELVSAGRRGLMFLAQRLLAILLFEELWSMLCAWSAYAISGAFYNLTPGFMANIIFLHQSDADKAFLTVTGVLFQRHRYIYLIGCVGPTQASTIKCLRLMATLWSDVLGARDRIVVLLCIVATAFTRFNKGYHDDLLRLVCGSLITYLVLLQPRQAYLERLEQEREAQNRFPNLPSPMARQLSVESASVASEVAPYFHPNMDPSFGIANPRAN